MVPSTKTPTIVLGLASVGDTTKDPLAKFDTPEEVTPVLDVFYNRGYRHVDTARGYSPHAPGSSEPRLGAVGVGDRFVVDTKVLSHQPSDHTAAGIAESVRGSLADLKVNQVNTNYLHVPQRATPFAETHGAMDEAFKAGSFKQMGLSNYSTDEVRQFLQLAADHGFVKPAVFQGAYNPISRGAEDELIPLLREHGMSFYAYSPSAGGFFSDKAKDARPGDRFDPSTFIGKLYTRLYRRPQVEEAANRVRALAKKHGINGHEAALRWTVYHGVLSAEHGDAVIIGASSIDQLNANLDAIEAGPLPTELADSMSGIKAALDEKDSAAVIF
ncbi:NADP-dependent oxidoreductase domain protein [Niveomyces insectorum RCEF 264]|uniref:NADP-dependent oxidoreductase domain protein n=1 Tax=Niveomyces insectorum RCEF 264 TaxID=1081102 RepID=A0A167UNT7_9HYPO|nr:NADP-dependent oxidoreductase domain protein [Niveomyces insectorum RCEF 264]